MTATFPPPIAPLTTAQAAQRAWQIRRLYSEGAVDRVAAFTSLDTLYQHPSPHVQRLCIAIAEKIYRPATPHAATPHATPIDGTATASIAQ